VIARQKAVEGMTKFVQPTAAQTKAARELLGWSRAAACKMLDRGLGVVGEVERGRGGETALARVAALYEAAGVEFLADGQVRIKSGGAK
jgi:hypothetical protein